MDILNVFILRISRSKFEHLVFNYRNRSSDRNPRERLRKTNRPIRSIFRR